MKFYRILKICIFFSFIYFFFDNFNLGFSETIVGSGRVNSFHWTTSGSPYIITGTANVPEMEPLHFDDQGNYIGYSDYNGNGEWDDFSILAREGQDAQVFLSLAGLDGKGRFQTMQLQFGPDDGPAVLVGYGDVDSVGQHDFATVCMAPAGIKTGERHRYQDLDLNGVLDTPL